MPRHLIQLLQCVLASCCIVVSCSSTDSTSTDTASTTESPAPEETTEAGTTDGAPVRSPGCGSDHARDATDAVNAERTLTAAKLERRFLLTVPPGHDGDTPLPVVFDFHGLAEGADVHARMSGWGEFATTNDIVAVLPHGSGEIPRWDGTNDESNQDLVFFDEMVETVAEELCIDMARIYTTGLSNGAMISTLLSCARSEVVAAAVLVAGVNDIQPCEQVRPVPALIYHGTDDPILLYNGGVDLSSLGLTDAIEGSVSATDLDGAGIPDNVRARAAANGCELDYDEQQPTADVTQRTYDCPEGADVQFNIVMDGGHSWPGSEFSAGIESVIGPTTFTVDATADGWEFMRTFTNSAAAPAAPE